MPSQLIPSLIPQPALQGWFVALNERLEAALLHITTTYDSLLMLIEGKEEDVYSNSVLQQRVKKEEESKRVLAYLLINKEHISKIIDQNKVLYQRKQAEYHEMQDVIEARKKKLINDLIAWKLRSPEYRLIQSQQEFKELQLAMKNIKDAAAIVKAFSPFIDKYKDVVELITDDAGYYIKCIPLRKVQDLASRRISISPESLKDKTTPQLKALAALTEDATLQEQANTLDHLRQDYDASYQYFCTVGIEQIQCLNEQFFDALNVKAKKLSQEYLRKSQELSDEAHAAYDAIAERNAPLRREIQAESRAIKKGCENLRAAFIRARGVSQLQYYRQVIRQYEELEKIHSHAADRMDLFQQRSARIVQKYEEAYQQFGDWPAQDANKASRQIRSLEKRIDGASSLLTWHGTDVAEMKQKIVIQNILNLFKRAIGKNLNFWNQQISSFWGSRASIGDISVPKGIAQLYDDLWLYDPTKGGELDVLTRFLSKVTTTVENRVNAGTGFFAKRALNTTDVFYRIIRDNIQLNKLHLFTSETVDKIEQELHQIKDVKGNRLVQLQQPLEPAPVSEEVEYSSFSRFLRNG